MNKLTALAATLSVAALMAGCTGLSATPSEVEVTGDNRPTTVSSAPASTEAEQPPTSEAEPTPTPTDDGVKNFGSSFTWEDNLSMTISAPKAFKPGEYSKEDGYTNYVVFDVTLVNKTGQPWDPSMFYVTLQSANEEAPKVYDTEQLGEQPSTKLLNGREAKFKVAFAVKDPTDLVMEVRPDFDHNSVLYELV